MDNGAEDLSLRTLIRAVTDELVQSQAERIAAGEIAVFEVSGLTLEVSFVATKSKPGGGGIDLKVIKADVGVKYDAQQVHKITLALKAVEDESQPFGLIGPVRPRRTAVQEPPDHG